MKYENMDSNYIENILEVDFLAHTVEKLNSDNHWLVRQLTDISQENE
jgi:hypothetical protein